MMRQIKKKKKKKLAERPIHKMTGMHKNSLNGLLKESGQNCSRYIDN